VYAATDDFGAQQGSMDLSALIGKAAEDFTRVLQSCGPHTRRDVCTEELTEMQRLLSDSQPRKDHDTVED
jgi:FMN reductase